jgi:hypothetical protein
VLADGAVPIELDGERGDLAAFSFLDVLADRARVAYLVEMDHFIAEKSAFRLLCIRYLASKGWRWFGEEVDVRIGDRLDRYLQTGDESLLEPLEEAPWYTTGILAEPTGRHDDRAMQLDRARLVRAVRSAVPGARWFGFDIGGGDADYLAAANAADTYEDLRPVMAMREQVMHERVARVLRENPSEKVALMAGSTHLAKDDDRIETPGVGAGPGGTTVHSIGHHVAHELTDGPVLSIWFLHGEGTSANAYLPPPGRLSPAAGTLDAELLARVGVPCILDVRHDHHRRSITQMHNPVLHCRLDEQVDAVVFAPEVHPLPA